jgi:AcrR family transcriptional regulator
MGNREDLISGAKRCLIEKGYARTTARDIAAASGVSLAAIGYHFGSKDALMNLAVFESVGEWADEVQRTLDGGDGDLPPLQRFEAIMAQTLESFAGPGRGLWAAQLELMSAGQQSEELRSFLAGIQDFAAGGLAELYLDINPEKDPAMARNAGGVLHAFFIGIVAKWFMDPAHAMTASELADGLRIISETMTGAHVRAPGVSVQPREAGR